MTGLTKRQAAAAAQVASLTGDEKAQALLTKMGVSHEDQASFLEKMRQRYDVKVAEACEHNKSVNVKKDTQNAPNAPTSDNSSPSFRMR